MSTLQIKDLHVSVEGKEILKGLNLEVKQGEIHALMGPNGSGKSTLAYVLMGHPKYKIEKGEILIDGKNILELSPDQRAKLGLFLGFQYPVEISGVTLASFLRSAYNSITGKENGTIGQEMLSVIQFRKFVKEKIKEFQMDESFAERYLNEGFSGGEKKRAEILQMSILKPKIAILDETDSGLDVDALKVVADGINKLTGPQLGVLLITHYSRILNYIKPQFVHVLVDGVIAKSGGEELARQLEEKGYDWIKVG